MTAPDPSATDAVIGKDDADGTLWKHLAPGDVVAMLDRLTDGIVVLGTDWCYRYLNDPAAAMLGRTREQLLGQHIWTEFPDGVGEPFHLAYEQAMREQRPMQFVEYYPPFDRWFENRLFPQGDSLVIVFHDVTERHRVDAELREYIDRMTEAERIARFGVWQWNIATGRVRWSDELQRIYGVVPGEFPGTVVGFLSRLHPDDCDRVWAHVSRAVETLEPFAFEERILHDDGEERVLFCQGRVIAGPDGRASTVVGVCHDVTERARAKRELGISERRIRAIIDNTPSIVAVKNLDGTYLMANAELGRLLDIAPDDLVGHACAEAFPAEVAAGLRDNDRRAAAHGEPVYGEVVLQHHGEPRHFVTVTFALPDDAGLPIETCTIGTDVTDNKQREAERRERSGWQKRFTAAMRDDRMLVFVQPVVDLTTGTAESYELLVRMQDDQNGGCVVQPDAFLPAAERFGLIQQIDVWMTSRALLLANRFAPHVNLSAVTMCDPASTQQIVDLLARSPQAARRIVFEITETAAAEHLEAARVFAAEISALGCGLALDDFGTGFASFTYLRTLPLRSLKIDRTFVRELLDSEDDRRIVQSTIAIAEQFGLQTIAEGVEDEATLELLRTMGVRFVQGFHLGRPAPSIGPRREIVAYS
jgi:PAS domain S-box-containing protein